MRLFEDPVDWGNMLVIIIAFPLFLISMCIYLSVSCWLRDRRERKEREKEDTK